jgi:hypothetical protein
MFCAQVSLCILFRGTIGIILGDVNDLVTLLVSS